MNHIYRSLYNKALGTWVAVPEIAKTHGKSAGGKSASFVLPAPRFAISALASALLLASGQVMAVTGTGSSSGNSNYCIYDETSQTVICGDGSTESVDTVAGKPAKSVVLGKGAKNTGESNVAVGISASSAGTSSVAVGDRAKTAADQAIAVGQNAQANARWDVSIGRQAGWNAAAPPGANPEGRNIALGDGALKNGLDVNNNTVMGTSAAANLKGTHNVILGTYANTVQAIESAESNGSTATQINAKTRKVAIIDGNTGLPAGEQEVKYIETANSVAIGHRALATKIAGVAVGQQAKALGNTSAAVGNGTRALGDNSVAMGNTANAGANGAIAIGQQANFDSNAAVAADKYKTTGANSVAIGVRAHSEATRSIAMGADSSAKAATVVGGKVTSKKHGEFTTNIVGATTAVGSVAIGPESIVNGTNAVAIGQASEALGQNTFAGGNDSHAIGKSSVAIGDGALSENDSTVALGYKATVHKEGLQNHQGTARTNSAGAVAIGSEASSAGTGSVAVGRKSQTTFINSAAVGNEAAAVGYNTSAFGYQAKAAGTSSIAIGDKALAGSHEAGSDSAPHTNRGIAIGTNTNATGETAVALGSNSESKAHRGTALGVLSQVTQHDGAALGAYSVANRAQGMAGTDVLGAKDAATPEHVWKATHAAVSVGNDAQHQASRQGNSATAGSFNMPLVTRQITGVAAGTNDTDAVNVAQLKAAGFKLTTSASAGEVENTTEEKVQNGETVTIDAGENIKITQANNKITVATRKNVIFDSVTAGSGANQVVLNNDGVKAGGNVLNGDAITVDGTNVTNVNSAINQVAEQAFKPLTFTGNTGSSERKLGQTLTISGGLPTTAPSSNSNVHTVVDSATGKVDIRIADNPNFNGKVSAKGLDAGGQQITGVADGTALSDAVNLDQLNKAIANANVTNATAVHANSPFSYVNNNGEQLVRKADGTFYKANDPSQAPYVGNDITISALNPNAPQTAVPTKVGNIAKGTKDTDAVNVSQLKDVANALGGGAGIDPNTGALTAPNYTITTTDGTQLPPATNVADALKNLNDQVVKPLTFGGDTGTAFERKLGSQVNIKGGATANLTDNNIGVHADNGTLTVKLAKDVNLGNDGSVKAGNTTVNNAGVTIANADPAKTVSLTSGGLNNGGNKITNVAKGDVNPNSTDAVNGSQLYEVQQAAAAAKTTVGSTDGSITVTPKQDPTGAPGTHYDLAIKTTELSVQNGAVETPVESNSMVKAGDIAKAINQSGFTLTTDNTGGGDVKGQSDELINPGEKVTIDAGKNISVTQETNKVSIATKDEVEFKQVTIGDANHNTVLSSTPEGLSVGGDRIVNVAAGSDDSDAVNVKQLRDEIAKNPGTIINNTYVVDNTTVSAGKGIKVTQNGDDYNVALADDITVSSLNAGPVTVDKDGLTINNNTYVDANGLNANDQVVRNVAPGRIAPDSKEAVNGAQLHALGQQLGDVDKRARAGIASAMASAGLPQAYRPGANMVAASAGHYDGQTAIAIGASTISDNGRWILKGTLNVNSKDAGATVGVGYQW